MDNNARFDRDDMEEYGDFCEMLGYLQRAEECAREHHQPIRCTRGIAGCTGRWDCLDRRAN